jgi:hypothetical protein
MKLYVTYCSGKKRTGFHTPDMLYISDRITGFIERCRTVGVDWAIFSALYALFFPTEKKKDYNVTLRTDNRYWLGITVIENEQKLSVERSKEHVLKLASTLRKQSAEHDVDQIVFFGPSPKMMKCYVSVLHFVFDDCSKSHDWRELIDHVKSTSNTIRIIHRRDSIC